VIVAAEDSSPFPAAVTVRIFTWYVMPGDRAFLVSDRAVMVKLPVACPDDAQVVPLSVEYSTRMTVAPKVVPSVEMTEIDVAAAEIDVTAGGEDTSYGVPDFIAEAVPFPEEFTARIRTWYAVPATSSPPVAEVPVIVNVADPWPDVRHVVPLSVEYSTRAIGLPLSDPRVPDTLSDSRLGSTAVSTGAFGTSPNTTETWFDGSDTPTAFVIRSLTWYVDPGVRAAPDDVFVIWIEVAVAHAEPQPAERQVPPLSVEYSIFDIAAPLFEPCVKVADSAPDATAKLVMVGADGLSVIVTPNAADVPAPSLLDTRTRSWYVDPKLREPPDEVSVAEK
jgi:hypothetical protein